MLIWWSGWGYYRETLPHSDRVQDTGYRVQGTVYSEQTAEATLKGYRIGVVPFGPQFIGGPDVLEQE